MTDYFALLDEPRRPWLEPEALKTKFLKLAAEIHPDRKHGAGKIEKAAANRSYAELNAAFNCLAEPKLRLLHLLELERGCETKGYPANSIRARRLVCRSGGDPPERR